MAQDYKGKIDFAVITIREDENRAVLQRFPPEEIYKGKHRSYGITRVPLLDNSYYLVAIIRSIEQGEGAAQDVARDVIEDLDPHWILLVGIAGGIPAAEFTLGDVVLATRLTDFSVTAAIDTKEGSKTQYAVSGGPMHKKVQDLLALLPAMTKELGDWNSEISIGSVKPKITLTAKNFYGSDSWKAKTKESLTRYFGRSAAPRSPLVTVGTVASSDTLMKDTQTLQQWQESARQLIAVEMELAGVYLAARRSEKEYPVLAIRGISDIVGFKRHPDWTEYACHSAAAFAYTFITTKPISERVAHEEKIVRQSERITVNANADSEITINAALAIVETPIPRQRVILIVDDEKGPMTYYRRLLQERGFYVEWCDKADKVIEDIKQYRPDLILLDLVMPPGKSSSNRDSGQRFHMGLPITGKYLSEFSLHLEMA